MTRIRIVIADDHPVVLAGLRALFADEEDFDVVAACNDGKEALAAITRLSPDVSVLDLRMPRVNGIELVRAIRAKSADARIVILAAAIEEDQVVEAMRLGVKGIVLKEMAPSMLVRAIRKVHEGGQWFEKESLGRALDRILQRTETLQSLRMILTDRELEIMALAAAGKGSREIAGALCIAQGTVKTHLHSVYAKLGVEGRVGLMVYAKERALL